jgi:uncharacterized protein (TIGR00730 family)
MPEQFHPEKAYRNLEFLSGPEARTIRILSEYLEPRDRLRRHRVRNTIVFFGSSRFKDMETAEAIAAEASTPEEKSRAQQLIRGAKYYEDARSLAYKLTEWVSENRDAGPDFFVCSGGGPGIMEAANRGAHEAGGKSLGFNISLPFEQKPNPYITPELNFDFHYFFMRKLWFAYLGKAIVVFPGGFGTLDEMMELLTLVQTDKLRKQMKILIYGREFWDRIVNLDALVEWGTISPEDLDLFEYADTPDEACKSLIPWLKEHYPPPPSAGMV